MKHYTPTENETENAANSYLMSLLAMMAGLPFPIVNLFATIIFYFANKRRTYFVRWHCTQALISQLPLFCTNTILFQWTIRIIFGYIELSSFYFAYLFTVLLFNIIDYIATIHTAIKVRQGKQVEWYVYGPLTDLLCKEKI